MNELINGRTPDEIKRWLRWATYSCMQTEDRCETCEYRDDCGEYCGSDTYKEALAYIEQLEVALKCEQVARTVLMEDMPKWISVKEQPPEFPCLYWDGINQIGITKSLATITLKSGKTVYLSDMFLRAFPDIKQSDVDSCTHILYWMPLPNPPKEDAHE